jgi:hypothetical protein
MLKVIEKNSGDKLWYKVEGSETLLCKLARILKIEVKQESGQNPKHLDLSKQQYNKIKNKI